MFTSPHIYPKRILGESGDKAGAERARRIAGGARGHPRPYRCLALGALILFGVVAASSVGPLQTQALAAPSNVSLAGVHWYSGDSGMLDTALPLGRRGWNVEVVFDVGWCDGDKGTDPGGVRAVAQTAKDHGLVNIIRVDYHDRVAVPTSSADYDAWASNFIKCTKELDDLSSLYIVGNEPNIEGGIGAAQYAAAFNSLYSRRGDMPTGTELLATFNSPFTSPDWMNEMASALGGVDGFAVHTGGIRGQCQDPRQPCSYGSWPFDGAFRYYRDVINNIPSTWWGKPVYITEFNTYTGDPGSEPQNNYQTDWINKAFEEVRGYNASRGRKPPVRALAWFVDRPQSWPLFSLRNITAARTDLSEEFKNPANLGGPAPTTPAPTTPPPSTGLLNGGFEGAIQGTGVGEGWASFTAGGYGASFAVVGDQVHSGSKAQRLRAQPTSNDQYAGIFQTVTTTSGTSYTVRAWSRVNLPGGSGWPLVARLGIDLTGGTDHTASSVAWVEFDAPENGVGNWVSRQKSITATGGRMTIFLQSWRKWAAGGASDTWFDDVEVVAAGVTPPAPTTPAPTTPAPTTPAPPGQNVALGKAWQASSVYNSNYGGDKATDGVVSVASKWTSNGSSAESWLALDLGQTYNLTGFVVRHAGAAGEATYFNTQAFRLESGSSFTGPWTTLASVNNAAQTNLSAVVLASSAAARFVRLAITDAGIDNYARIPELEVYAQGTVTPPPTTPAPTTPPPPTPPPPTATMPPNCPPALDFDAIRAELNSRGQDLAFVKIGFHVQVAGNHTGLGNWEQCLDAAGVPFFLKSVSDAGRIMAAADLKVASGVPHTLVYRKCCQENGQDYELPNYNLPPYDAAVEHWQRHLQALHRAFTITDGSGDRIDVLDRYKGLFWVETINEPDKAIAEWLAAFSYYTSQMAMADGFNYAAFAWSSGEPEPAQWLGPPGATRACGPNDVFPSNECSWMRAFLELAAANPDRVAVSLHEYEYFHDDLQGSYPNLVGRFEALYRATDMMGISRPTVVITEFGWPGGPSSVEKAMRVDYPWAAQLYAGYPEIKGAAIWCLGNGCPPQTQPSIGPMTEYALQHYFVLPQLEAVAEGTQILPGQEPSP